MDHRTTTAGDGDLLRASGEDPQAYAAFYRRHERLVLGWLIRRGCSVEDAADLTAETFAAAWLARSRYRDDAGGAAPWLLGIAANKWRMSARRRRIERGARDRLGMQRVRLADDDREALEALFSDADAWLAALPGDQRAAVLAHVVEERRYREVAERLDIAEPAARKRVSRGLAALRRHLGDDGACP